MLNIGCGEGQFLRSLVARANANGESNLGLWGVDSSKLAVRYAAKRRRKASFAVCAPHTLPFADGVFSTIFSVTRGNGVLRVPVEWDECCRVLRPGGAIIVARLGSDHLLELRSESERLQQQAPPKQFAAGLAENYVRHRSEQMYCGALADSLRAMAPEVAASSAAQGAAKAGRAERKSSWNRGGDYCHCSLGRAGLHCCLGAAMFNRAASTHTACHEHRTPDPAEEGGVPAWCATVSAIPVDTAQGPGPASLRRFWAVAIPSR